MVTHAYGVERGGLNHKALSAEIERISGRIAKVKASDYPVWVLEKQLADITRDRQIILQQLEQIEATLVQALTQGHVESIEASQAAANKLRKKDKGLQEDYQKAFNFRQERILKERITQRLGGAHGYKVKEIIITALIVFVLSLMIYEELTPSLPDHVLRSFFWIDSACCVVFLGDFFFELNLADSKAWFWQRHFIDFITSIPVPQARTLRAFRGIRIVRLLRFARFLRFFRFLRVLRVLLFFWRGLDHLVQMFNVRLMRKSLIYAAISLVMGAIAFQFFENPETLSDQNGVITSLWWSFTTVVTGGFADIHDPVTMGGKLLTVVLVILGMVIVGIFTATLTTVMVGDEDDIEQLRSDMNHQFEQLFARIDQS
ncbi:MAG: ion transporter [Leptolyngbya sp.]|nr:ion transporter [Leptolyngbya sp.]